MILNDEPSSDSRSSAIALATDRGSTLPKDGKSCHFSPIFESPNEFVRVIACRGRPWSCVKHSAVVLSFRFFRLHSPSLCLRASVVHCSSSSLSVLFPWRLRG